jgi:hypothetical protein
MLGFGGAGGIINMSYQLNESVHNTQWVTGHFHLIFGGRIVIMYFMVAYDLWPQLTQCGPLPQGLVRDTAVAVVRRHAGALDAVASRGIARACRGGWRITTTRPPALLAQAWTVDRFHDRRSPARHLRGPLRLCARPRTRQRRRVRSVHVQSHCERTERTPAALNAFGIWVAMMIGLTVVNYGYPIVQLAMLKETSVRPFTSGDRDGWPWGARTGERRNALDRLALRADGRSVPRRIPRAARGTSRLYGRRILERNLSCGWGCHRAGVATPQRPARRSTIDRRRAASGDGGRRIERIDRPRRDGSRFNNAACATVRRG